MVLKSHPSHRYLTIIRIGCPLLLEAERADEGDLDTFGEVSQSSSQSLSTK